MICCGLEECGFAWDDLMEVQKDRFLFEQFSETMAKDIITDMKPIRTRRDPVTGEIYEIVREEVGDSFTLE